MYTQGFPVSLCMCGMGLENEWACEGSFDQPTLQLENVDVVVADHVQRVMKPNFAASWEEIGDENQVEETFALSSMKDIQGS